MPTTQQNAKITACQKGNKNILQHNNTTGDTVSSHSSKVNTFCEWLQIFENQKIDFKCPFFKSLKSDDHFHGLLASQNCIRMPSGRRWCLCTKAIIKCILEFSLKSSYYCTIRWTLGACQFPVNHHCLILQLGLQFKRPAQAERKPDKKLIQESQRCVCAFKHFL